jgi:hypothetical protein
LIKPAGLFFLTGLSSRRCNDLMQNAEMNSSPAAHGLVILGELWI